MGHHPDVQTWKKQQLLKNEPGIWRESSVYHQHDKLHQDHLCGLPRGDHMDASHTVRGPPVQGERQVQEYILYPHSTSSSLRTNFGILFLNSVRTSFEQFSSRQ